MELERDLFLTKEFVLCEAGSLEAAFLFHRKGQLVTPQEDVQFGVSAYLERTRSQRERDERQRILATIKAVSAVEVENKAVSPEETEDKGLVGPVRRREPR